MFKRLLFIGALSICLIALIGTNTVQASRVCMMYLGSTCVFYVGGVVGSLNAAGVHVGDELGFLVEPPIGQETIDVIVFCGNGGRFSHVAKGVNPGEIWGKLSAYRVLRKNDIRNGRVTDFIVHWRPDDTTLGQVDGVCAECMNPNWLAVDVVPIWWSGEIQLLDEDGNVVATETRCYELPNPETLEWDHKAKAPEYREYKEVECQ